MTHLRFPLRGVKGLLFLVLGFVFMFFLTHKTEQNKPLKQSIHIVTTFSVLNDFVHNVIGNDLKSRFNISYIVKENTDPHTYQPLPKDSKLLANADLVIVNGLGFECWIDRLIAASGYNKNIITATENVPPRNFEDEPDTKDPHAWHNVENAIKYVESIATAIGELDPKHTDIYSKNAQNYIKHLKTLHTWTHALFKRIPRHKRLVLTTHDAFWYFGDAYDVKFIAPVGLSTEMQSSAADVAKIIQYIKSKNVRAIFIENLSNSGVVSQIAQETGTKIHGILYADSLSTSDGPAATYIDMVKHNALSIFKALSA